MEGWHYSDGVYRHVDHFAWHTSLQHNRFYHASSEQSDREQRNLHPPVNVNGCPVTTGATQVFTAVTLPAGTTGQNNQTWDNTPNSTPIQPELTSEVWLDPAQMNTSAGSFSIGYATRSVAHETMHDYGDGDAPDQDPNLTLMSYQGTPDDPGLTSPSQYDINFAFQYSGGGDSGGPEPGGGDPPNPVNGPPGTN